jgi:DNA-binding transcriptional regulator GbsR (MarR family)
VEVQNAPVFSVESLVAATGRSTSSVGAAVNRLQEAGIISLTTRGKRNRVFEAPEVLEEFGIIERRLASPRAGHEGGEAGKAGPGAGREA